jgi:hypothetical protein
MTRIQATYTTGCFNFLHTVSSFSFPFYRSRLDNVIMRLNADVLLYDWKQGPHVQQSSSIQDSASQ